MARVRFNLRKNPGKDAYIQMVYRIKGDDKKLVIGTKRHVDPRLWNHKIMRVRVQKGDYEATLTNEILNKWEASVYRAMQPYELKGIIPSKLELKRDIKELMSNSDHKPSNSNDDQFLKYFEKFIALRSSTKLAPGTIRQYKNAYRHLSEFIKKNLNNSTVEFKDMDREFYIRFIQYLSESRANNTVHSIIRRIRTVLRDAEDNGLSVNLDYKKKHTQVPYRRQPKIYLSNEEIALIQNYKLEPLTRLDKVRDRLFIGLDTGQRFSDFNRLNEDFVTHLDKGKEVFEIRNKKTGKFVIIPLKSRVREILNKHKGYPPAISEQKFNAYIKELLKLAGVNRKVSRIENEKQVIYEKWQLATSHICRRSFATNAYKAGIKPRLIMSITGHSTLRQFMQYICIDDEEAVEMVIDDPFFK